MQLIPPDGRREERTPKSVARNIERGKEEKAYSGLHRREAKTENKREKKK